jgi:rubrerythrin
LKKKTRWTRIELDERLKLRAARKAFHLARLAAEEAGALYNSGIARALTNVDADPSEHVFCLDCGLVMVGDKKGPTVCPECVPASSKAAAGAK